ncbi:killer cell lectin-like receptor 5 [Grammomys surdaster]|uniref:killer cell lectin-like receptor 5 n=1 Tax=Grammomys surdaster TaxID=491861 RepID=UPI00109F258A|nr:killer cell lectin-like receptor 5 [Grammomys surdaster]
MSEQEVTYSSVRFHKTSGLKNQVRPENTQGARKAGHRKSSVPQKLIVIALGLLCSILLVTVAVLVANIFQYRHEKHELQETLNRQNNCSTMQYEIDLKEKLLRNKSIEGGPGKELLESLNKAPNRWYSETKTALNSFQDTGKGVETYGFCNGIKCYSFTMDKKTWSGCNQTCQYYRLSLLKIDDEDELKFLQLQVTPDSYWIGLSYDKEKEEWAWIDKGPSNLDLNVKFKLSDGRCVFLSKTRLENINCDNLYSCFCGKQLNNFPD